MCLANSRRFAAAIVGMIGLVCAAAFGPPVREAAGPIGGHDYVANRTAQPPDTLVWLFCTKEQLGVNGVWDASDSPHPAWPQVEPDSVIADISGAFIKIAQVYKLLPDDGPGDWSSSVCKPQPFDDPYLEDGWAARFVWLWFDLDALPIASPQILNADIGMFYAGSYTHGDNDYARVVLDTLTADLRWLDAPMYLYGTTVTRFTQSSWNYIDGDSTAWDPPLADRRYWYDIGVGGTKIYYDSSDTTALYNPITFDVTESTEYVLHYNKPNAGYILNIYNQPNLTGKNLLRAAVETTTLPEYQPFLVVKFVKTQSRLPWNGKAFAWSFQTDDNYIVNLEYADTLEAYGYRFTIGIRGDQVDGYNGYVNSNHLSVADLRNLYAAGHEIASHSLDHWGPDDFGDSTRIWGTAEACCDPDSVYHQMSRDWLMEVLGLSASDTLDAIRNFFAPRGGINTLMTNVADTLDLWSVRGVTEFGSFGPKPAWGGGPENIITWRDTVDVYRITCGASGDEYFGPADSSYTEAKIASEIRRIIAKAWDETGGYAAFGLWTHGEKGLPYGLGSVDPDELGAAIRYLKSRGDVYIGRLRDIMYIYRSSHMSYDGGHHWVLPE